MKVGDYVRTKNGMIAKIIDKKDISGSLHDTNEVYILSNKIVLSVYSKRVKKYSLNIIDLIEVGDFIGKTIVEEIKEFDDGTRIIVMADGFDEYDENEYILKAGIVTHEQFESMEYRIGE